MVEPVADVERAALKGALARSLLREISEQASPDFATTLFITFSVIRGLWSSH